MSRLLCLDSGRARRATEGPIHLQFDVYVNMMYNVSMPACLIDCMSFPWSAYRTVMLCIVDNKRTLPPTR